MNHEPSGLFRPLRRFATAGALVAALLLVATAALIRVLFAERPRIASLEWFDVATVQILCATPIAWWAGVWSKRLRPGGRVLLVAAGFVVVVALAVSARGPSAGLWWIESVLMSTMVVLAASLCTILIVGLCRSSARVPFSSFTALSLLMVAYIVPATVLHARLRNEATRLTELLEQSRYGEALDVAGPVASLDSNVVINGRSIDEVRRTLSQGVQVLRSQAEAPLPPAATDDQRRGRARALAMLGRTDAALAELAACRNVSVDGLLLEGTIRETRSEWDRGREKYAEARAQLEKQVATPANRPLLLQAIRGVAYCSRKAGRTQEAEASYQAMLALSPTADVHFLVAQFYEDAQSTSFAMRHARQAIALDSRYREPAGALINKLQTTHFGCWGVYTSGLGGR